MINTSPTRQPLPFIFLIIILINLSAIVTAQTYLCYGNYTISSTYSTNLNTLLSSLPSNMDKYGFNHASQGEKQDRANAMALCRADIQLDSCRSCVLKATTELLNSCPNGKQAILWRDDCMLRYSNESIFGHVSSDPAVILRGLVDLSEVNETRPAESFEDNVRALLDKLRGEAVYGSPVLKVSAGNRSASGFDTIYAMVQCTPDLSPENCSDCLMNRTYDLLPLVSKDSSGVRILTPSCNIRYELYNFFNSAVLQERRRLA